MRTLHITEVWRADRRAGKSPDHSEVDARVCGVNLGRAASGVWGWDLCKRGRWALWALVAIRGFGSASSLVNRRRLVGTNPASMSDSAIMRLSRSGKGCLSDMATMRHVDRRSVWMSGCPISINVVLNAGRYHSHIIRWEANGGSVARKKVLGNPEHIALVRRGAAVFGVWRKAHPKVKLDLRGADLDGMKLPGANLSAASFGAASPHDRPATLENAKLRNAQIQRSYMRMVDLSGADLREVVFQGSQLSIVDFSFADLRAADLRQCIFIATDFHRANLRGADVSGSIIGHTRFTAVDLTDVKGLSELQHEYPSSIDTETLLRSRILSRRRSSKAAESQTP